jgi:hypothetical protein
MNGRNGETNYENALSLKREDRRSQNYIRRLKYATASFAADLQLP